MCFPIQKSQKVHWKENELANLKGFWINRRRRITTGMKKELHYHFAWVWWSKVLWRPRRFLWGSSGRAGWLASWGSCWSLLCSRVDSGTGPGYWKWRFHRTKAQMQEAGFGSWLCSSSVVTTMKNAHLYLNRILTKSGSLSSQRTSRHFKMFMLIHKTTCK